MDNTTNPALADAQRRLQALREDEARLAEQQRTEQQRADENRERERDERQGQMPRQGADAQADQRDQERANQQEDRRDQDRLQDARRREDDYRAEDRRKEDDRRKEEREAARRPDAEEVNASQVTERIDVSRVGKIEQSEDNSLIAQVQRQKAEQSGVQAAQSSETSETSSRPGDRGGKSILDPNDLANQERQQQSPLPGGERVNSAQITEGEAKAERAHAAQGVRNQMASRDAMNESLGRGEAGGVSGSLSVAERTRARNSQVTEQNVAAGKSEPPAATREFAMNSQQRLEVEAAKAQEKEAVKKPELTQ